METRAHRSLAYTIGRAPLFGNIANRLSREKKAVLFSIAIAGVSQRAARVLSVVDRIARDLVEPSTTEDRVKDLLGA
jgi:hypothetical protein